MAAVNRHGRALEYASLRLRGSQDIVMATVNEDCSTLQYASNELRAERDVVLVAIHSDSRGLEYASVALRADEDIVMTAVRAYPSQLMHVATTLRSNFGFLAHVISERNEWALRYVTRNIKDAVRSCTNMFDTFPEARNFLQGSVQFRDAFMEFLCCVRSESAAALENPVTKVNLDTETSKKLHRHIAEYAGVPLDQRLEPVRLVKRIMPIIVAVYENRGANEQNLFHLLELSRMRSRPASGYSDDNQESDDD